MSSVSLPVESAKYGECLEDALGGINAVVQIIPISAIEYFPEIGTVQGQSNIFSISEMEKLVSAGGDILLKPNNGSIFLPCRFELNELEITSKKGAWDTKCTIHLQNTTHNRGVHQQLKKIRFIVIVQDLATGDKLIIGRHKADTVQEGAFVVKEDGKHSFGKEYESEGEISFSIASKKNIPLTHYGRIVGTWEHLVTSDPIGLGGSDKVIVNDTTPVLFDYYKAFEGGRVLYAGQTKVLSPLEFETPSIDYSGFEPVVLLQNGQTVQMYIDSEGKVWTNPDSTNGGEIINGHTIYIKFYDEF